MKSLRRSTIIWTLTAVIAILAVAIACGTGATAPPSPTPTATPAPTSTPSPVPLPTPTPTPTPPLPPTATPPPSAAAPGPEPQQPTALEPLKLVAGGPGPLTELAAAVPDLYERVSFIDLTVDVPFESLGDALEQQLSILGPVADLVTEQVDAALLAQAGPGIMVVIRGRLDPQTVLDALGAEVRIDSYGDFEIWNVKVSVGPLSATVAVSLLDDTTAVLAVGLSPAMTSGDLARAALDVVTGERPGYLDSAMRGLAERLPRGFNMTLSRPCTGFSETPEIQGCVGVAFSSNLEIDDGALLTTFVFGFPAPEAALEALPAIEASWTLVTGDPPDPLWLGTQVAQDGVYVLVSGKVDIDQTSEGIPGLEGP